MAEDIATLQSQESIYLLDDDTIDFKSLYQRASVQQWDADRDLNWDQGPQVSDDTRESWIRVINLFYSLELMGLATLNNMLGKTANKFKDVDLRVYLSAQSIDEARHVYVLKKYLGEMGVTPSTSMQTVVDKLGSIASKGFYNVENFLFSTLFSENFASMYLRLCIEKPIDPLAREIFKKILQDEGRHVKFQHLIMPYVVKHSSSVGKMIMKSTHMWLMTFVGMGIKMIKGDSEKIGINSEEFLDRLMNQLTRQYEKIGVSELVDMQKIREKIGKNIFK